MSCQNKTFLILMLWLPLTSFGQIDTAKGIKFIENLSWKEVLKKAKKENKFIFVDCFATWCGPCKEMDKEVYTNNEVGDFFNQHFLSVKLQMDRTKKDDGRIKSWYSTASFFGKEYGVPAYPTLLFFSPKGELVSRVTGYCQDKRLIQEGTKSMVPGIKAPYRIYYKLLARYQQGIKDYAVMAGLADTAKQLNQKDIASEVANEYKPYLVKRQTVWYTQTNLSFMASFIDGSKDPFFDVFYRNRDRVDSIMRQKGFAQYVVDTIIQREEIEPITKPNKGIRSSDEKPLKKNEPNWNELLQQIAKKYDQDYAERNVLLARISWYNDQLDWTMSAKYLTVYLKRYPITFINGKIGTFLNSTCWDAIFKRSVDKEQIDIAIDAMEKVLNKFDTSSEVMDTYANLLYKSGKKSEAIKYEEQAIRNAYSSGELKKTLQRMKNNKPTWPHYISNDFWDDGEMD